MRSKLHARTATCMPIRACLGASCKRGFPTLPYPKPYLTINPKLPYPSAQQQVRSQSPQAPKQSEASPAAQAAREASELHAVEVVRGGQPGEPHAQQEVCGHCVGRVEREVSLQGRDARADAC